jgi:hypothetical protein
MWAPSFGLNFPIFFLAKVLMSYSAIAHSFQSQNGISILAADSDIV